MIIGKMDVDQEILKATIRLREKIDGIVVTKTRFMGRKVTCLIHVDDSLLSLKSLDTTMLFFDINGDWLNHG